MRYESPIDFENSDELLTAFRAFNSWNQGDIRAPHKPLLVLLALGEFSRGNRVLEFVGIRGKLSELLRDFGPSRARYAPEEPYWRLRAEHIWWVEADGAIRPRASNASSARVEDLKAFNARAGFTREVERRLSDTPELVYQIAHQVLADNFPETVHQDILDAIGLEASEPRYVVSRRRRRDPRFRFLVLDAYEHRCAVCGFDLQIGARRLALEAAHIQWHEADGPDIVANGIALCALHHKVFDSGAFTIDTDHRLLVSPHVSGSLRLDEVLLRHHGEPVFVPKQEAHLPNFRYLEWHRGVVFKKDPRSRTGLQRLQKLTCSLPAVPTQR